MAEFGKDIRLPWGRRGPGLGVAGTEYGREVRLPQASGVRVSDIYFLCQAPSVEYRIQCIFIAALYPPFRVTHQGFRRVQADWHS